MARIRVPRTPILWSPSLAYAVGLLTTDGNLSRDGRHIAFGSKDRSLVRILLKILHHERRSRIAKTSQSGFSHHAYYRVQMSNVRLYDQLTRIGLTPRKSKTLGPLDIPDRFFRDFLRGHLDGDGTVYTYVDTYNARRWNRSKYAYTRLYLRFISASGRHIRWIADTVDRLLSISGSVTNQNNRLDPQSVMWEVKYAKRDTLALLRWMYYAPDVPCLARKKEIVIHFLRNASGNVDTRRPSWYRSNVTALQKSLTRTGSDR